MDTKSGQIFITAISGNHQKLDGGAMFGNAPRPVWEKWLAPDELGRVELQCRALLIETPALKILCETGIGAFFEPKLAERFGVVEREHMLLKNLERAGVKPAEINYVVLSHLHFDHAGGLLPTYDEIQSGNQGLAFSNAKIIVGKEAYKRSKAPHDRDRASFIPGLNDKLEQSNRLLVVQPDGSGLPSGLNGLISFRYSEGHTPGQMHTIVHGEHHKVVFAGDLIPGLAWVHLPITMGYDRFPERLIDEKRELYQTAAPEDWYLFFTHDPTVAMAKVKQDASGKYQPYDQIAQPEHLPI